MVEENLFDSDSENGGKGGFGNVDAEDLDLFDYVAPSGQ